MEHKDILAIICAVGVVILVIGVLNMLRNSSKPQEDSVPDIAYTQEPIILTEKTDIWDEIRAQNTTTETETVPLPEVTGTDISGEFTDTLPADFDPMLTDISASDTGSLPADAAVQTELTELTTETTAVTKPAEPAEPYVIVVQ